MTSPRAARLAPTSSEWTNAVRGSSATSIVRAFAHKRTRCQPGEYSPRGILALAKRALAAYTEATGKKFPYNAGTYGWRGEGLSRRPRPDQDGKLQEAARIAGWFRTVSAGGHALVRRLLDKMVRSDRGVNSPHQIGDPVQVARANPSPGRLNARLGKIIRRADTILAPYGVRVSWRAIITIAQRPLGRTGKEALQAARITLGHVLSNRGLPCPWGQDSMIAAQGLAAFLRLSIGQQWAAREAAEKGASLREAVAHAHGLVRHEADGVVSWLDASTRTVEKHIECFDAVMEYRSRGRSADSAARAIVATCGRRSFHTFAYVGMDHALARREAVKAWRLQAQTQSTARHKRRQQAEDAALDAVCANGGTDALSVLVSVNDSLSSGNCLPGTLQFLADAGLPPKARLLPVAQVWPLKEKFPGLSGRISAACRVAARKALRA